MAGFEFTEIDEPNEISKTVSKQQDKLSLDTLPLADSTSTSGVNEIIRTSFNNVAPGARNFPELDPNRNPNANGVDGQPKWRAGFGEEVAPIAVKSITGETNKFDPNAGYGTPWRQSIDVAPAARSLPVDQTGPAGPTGTKEQKEPWRTAPAPAFPGVQTDGGARTPGPKSGPSDEEYRRFQEQQIKDLQTRRGVPSGMPGAGDNSGGIKSVSPEQRQKMQDALKPFTPLSSMVQMGAGVGAGVGAFSYFMDNAMLKAGQHAAKFDWWKPYSPMLNMAGGNELLDDRKEKIAAKYALADELTIKANSGSDASAGSILQNQREKIISEYHRQLLDQLNAHEKGASPLNDKQLQLLRDQFDATKPENLDKLRTLVKLQNGESTIQKSLGSLIVGSEGQIGDLAIGGQRVVFNKDTEIGRAISELGSTNDSVHALAARAEVLRAEARQMEKALSSFKIPELETPKLSRYMLINGGRGIVGSGAGVLAGATLDTAFNVLTGNGFKTPGIDHPNWMMLDAAAGAMIANGAWRSTGQRMVMAGTGLLLGRHLVQSSWMGPLPEMHTDWSLAKPNLVDAAGLAAAATVPLKPGNNNLATRLVIGGAVLAGGRLWNMVAAPTDGTVVLKNSDKARFTDWSERTENSFDKAVQAELALARLEAGMTNLGGQIADLIQNRQAKMSKEQFFRESAILRYAAGLASWERGSRIVIAGRNTSVEDINSPKNRLLKSHKIDWYDESAENMRLAYASLVQMQRNILEEKNKVVADTAISSTERDKRVQDIDQRIKQAESLRKKVQANIDIIYGEHDIPAVWKELQGNFRGRYTDMLNLIKFNADKLARMSDKVDPATRAKASRDTILGTMLLADNALAHNNGEDARLHIQEARRLLNVANALAPSHANTPKLKAIIDEYAKKVPGALDDQYKPGYNNPFEINRPRY